MALPNTKDLSSLLHFVNDDNNRNVCQEVTNQKEYSDFLDRWKGIGQRTFFSLKLVHDELRETEKALAGEKTRVDELQALLSKVMNERDSLKKGLAHAESHLKSTKTDMNNKLAGLAADKGKLSQENAKQQDQIGKMQKEIEVKTSTLNEKENSLENAMLEITRLKQQNQNLINDLNKGKDTLKKVYQLMQLDLPKSLKVEAEQELGIQNGNRASALTSAEPLKSLEYYPPCDKNPLKRKNDSNNGSSSQLVSAEESSESPKKSGRNRRNTTTTSAHVAPGNANSPMDMKNTVFITCEDARPAQNPPQTTTRGHSFGQMAQTEDLLTFDSLAISQPQAVPLVFSPGVQPNSIGNVVAEQVETPQLQQRTPSLTQRNYRGNQRRH